MLEVARQHLKPGGRLYFPVISLSNFHRIMDTAGSVFGSCLEMVGQKFIPFCEEFKRNLPRLEQLRQTGLIDFVAKRSRRLWQLSVYRAWLSA